MQIGRDSEYFQLLISREYSGELHYIVSCDYDNHFDEIRFEIKQ